MAHVGALDEPMIDTQLNYASSEVAERLPTTVDNNFPYLELASVGIKTI